MEKAVAMSVKRPIGINSEVLKIKAAQVNPISANQFFVDIALFVIWAAKLYILWIRVTINRGNM